MDLRQLRYFIAIVDAGSLSRAAERLHVAQPSLSQQVSSMEDDLGVPLLLRTSQGAVPTEAGTTLYRHARLMLRQMEQLRAEVKTPAGEVGPVSVGLPTSVAAVVGVSLYDALRAQHPGVRLHLIEGMSGNLADLLAAGRLDMAVLFRNAESRGLHVLPLLWDSLSLYARPDTLADARLCDIVDPAALSNLPLVLPGPGNGLRELIERIFARAGSELNVVADVDALPTLLELASRTGVGTILSSALSAVASRAGLGAVHLGGSEASRPVSLCWPSAVPASAATEATRRTLVAVCSALAAGGGWPGATIDRDLRSTQP